MATGHRVYSDLFRLSNIVQQTAVTHGKNILIDSLRDYFKQDSIYRYETDAFGFPLTPDLTDMNPDIENTCTTRIFIGDIFRFDKRFWPAIVVRYSSGKYRPVSFNQNYSTRYRMDLVLDGYGNKSYIHVPTHTTVAGAWEQTFEIKIASESTMDREELADIISVFLIGKQRQELYEGGLFIKSVNIGSESEETWGNDPVYLQSITVDTYSEWRIEIPINNLIEGINFCFEYGLFGSGNSVTDTFIVRTEDIVSF